MAKREICLKSCCWTPFETCARQHKCGCHANRDESRLAGLAAKRRFDALWQAAREQDQRDEEARQRRMKVNGIV